ncbi:hypothetical protein, partial [Sutterella massiliensis]|uniref:hypothetical protein n=1 Tax=Sutterella massiliensis TaxID=1816689 RepID=UPI00195FAA32
LRLEEDSVNATLCLILFEAFPAHKDAIENAVAQGCKLRATDSVKETLNVSLQRSDNFRGEKHMHR